MSTYLVTTKSTTYLEYLVEADTPEEAMENTHKGEFVRYQDDCDEEPIAVQLVSNEEAQK